MVVSEVIEALAKEGFKAEVKEVKKANVTKKGICVIKEGSKVGLNIYEENLRGLTSAEAVEKILEIVAENYKEEFNGFDLDPEKVKTSLRVGVCVWENNKEFLKDKPYQMYGFNLAVYARYVFKSEDGCPCSIVITNKVLELLGWTKGRLIGEALIQTEKVASIKGMFDTLCELMPNKDIPAPPDFDEKMLVVSTKDRIHGAGLIASAETLDKVCNLFKCDDIVILPSSIHEFICMPDTAETDYEELRNMVEEINRTEVAPDEVLSNNVYGYTLNTREVSILA